MSLVPPFLILLLPVKPVILLQKSTYVYKRGMIINCTLANVDINPPEVNFTWYSCGSSNCSETTTLATKESLRLDSQSTPLGNYRCKAQNAAGSDDEDLVVMQLQNLSKDSHKLSNIRTVYRIVKHCYCMILMTAILYKCYTK
jgi:hypothetical protein